MMDSLPYRNDAAHGAAPADPLAADARGRARRGDLRQGAAGHDDGAGGDARSAVRPRARRRDAAADGRRGRRQGADHRRPLRARRRSRLQEAAELGCRACASPGGGCQFLGTAATSQVVGEALGLSLPHSALAPSGQPIWLDMARRSARAVAHLEDRGITTRRHAHRRRRPQRHGGARGVRRLDEPAAAHPRHRLPRRAAPADGRRLDRTSTAGCRGWSMRCPTARSAIRRCASSWPAACRR